MKIVADAAQLIVGEIGDGGKINHTHQWVLRFA